jgi:hypothetical protein
MKKMVEIKWNGQIFRVPRDLSQAWDYKMFTPHTVARRGMYALEMAVNQFMGQVIWERN